MEKRHGPWTIHETALKYEHELLRVFEDGVTKPGGEPGTYAVVRIKPGASVLALDDEGFVYLAREFRYAAGRETIEVVGGAIDEGERPGDAARRELREELGIEAANYTALGTVDPMTSLIDSPSHLFLATGLTFKEKRNEGSERIKTVRLRLEDAVRKALGGEITHGASCVLILRAWNHLKGDAPRG